MENVTTPAPAPANAPVPIPAPAEKPLSWPRFALANVLIAAAVFGGAGLWMRYEKIPTSPVGYYREKYNRDKPNWVILGNSLAGSNIDTEYLKAKFKNKIENFKRDGSYSAFWYIALKNVFMELGQKPKVVMVVFRDTDLTDPTYGLEGFRETHILALSEGKEETLDRKVWEPYMGKFGNFLFQHLAFVRNREEIKALVYPQVKRMTSALLGRPLDAVTEQANKVLNEPGRSALSTANPDARLTRETFGERLGKSLLPDMVAMAKKEKIILVMVRAKDRVYLTKPESERMKEYTRQLRAYLEGNGAYFFDYSAAKDVQEKHFASDDHLNEQGKKIFTETLYKDLLKITNRVPPAPK